MDRRASQYFMYGIIISYKEYQERVANPMKYSNMRIFLDEDEDIHGIFTGRDGEFIILGKVLENIYDDNEEPRIIPELEPVDMHIIKKMIEDRYGIAGEFHYYFIKKYR